MYDLGTQVGKKKYTQKYRKRPKYSMDLAYNKGGTEINVKRNTLFSKKCWEATYGEKCNWIHTSHKGKFQMRQKDAKDQSLKVIEKTFVY